MLIKRVAPLAVLALLLLPAISFASGFGFYEHGAKATAMAGAFVASADDASAIYYNPAAIVFLDNKTNIYGQIHPVNPSYTATLGSVSTDGETGWQPPGGGFITYKLTDSVSAGVGVFLPYGLEVKWPKNWIGSALSQRTFAKIFYIRPTLAFKVNENFAIGGGVDIVYADITLEQQSPFSISPQLPGGRVETEITGTGTGYGFTVGALYKISDNVKLGVKYQHEVEVDFEDGEVDFTYIASGHPLVDAIGGSLFVNQGVMTTLNLPAEFIVGLAFNPNEKSTIEVDYQWTKWSVFDKLDVEFDNPQLNFTEDSRWEDSWMVRVGGEYWVAHEWAVRGGYIYDTNPIPDETLRPLIPDADRNEVTIGLGYDSQETCCWGNWTADFAAQWVFFDDRTSAFAPFPATYETEVFILGFGIGFSF